VGDLNDDGYADFVASAPWWDLDFPQNNYQRVEASSGAAYLYLGTADGMPSAPDRLLGGYALHSSGDNLGLAMSPAGDFDGDGVDDVALGALGEDNASWCQPCRVNNASNSDVGAALVFRGGQGLTARAPDAPLARWNDPKFVVCGPPVTNARVGREVAGGFDLNADGYDDLLLSNWDWNSQRGQVWYVLGHPATDPYALTCMSESVHLLGTGVTTSDFLGWGIGGADLNGDGCDDAVASAYNDDAPGKANSGAVHVWLGWGGPSCPAQRVHVTLYGAVANDNVGYRLAFPGDMNGDGVPELAVGSSGYGTTNVGAVLLYDGAALRGMLADAQEGDTFSLTSGLLAGQLLQPDRLPNTLFAHGLQAAGDLNGDGLGDLIVGERFANVFGVLRRGAAYVYYGSGDDAELQAPDVFIGGRAEYPDSEFGFSVAAAPLYDQGPAALWIGAPLDERPGPLQGELGASYFGLFPSTP
jgi:hypothetical protein